jgi:hypothetical protein
VLAQIGDEHVEVDARAAEPAVQGFAAHLVFAGELGQIKKGGVGAQDASVLAGETMPSGAFSMIRASRERGSGACASRPSDRTGESRSRISDAFSWRTGRR